MRIKEQYLDNHIKNPFGPESVWVRSIPPEMYPHYAAHGYSDMFEDDVKKVVKTKAKRKPSVKKEKPMTAKEFSEATFFKPEPVVEEKPEVIVFFQKKTS